MAASELQWVYKIYDGPILQTNLRLLSVSAGYGSQGLDEAPISYSVDVPLDARKVPNQGSSRTSLLTLPLGTGYSLMGGSGAAPFPKQDIEVWLVDPTTGNEKRIHRGFISGHSISLSGTTEKIHYESKTHDIQIGNPLDGLWVTKDPPAAATPLEPNVELLIQGDTVFNPEVDGEIVGNQTVAVWPGRNSHIFVHPGQIATSADAAEWTLERAVMYLLEWFNSAETWVKNPTPAAVKRAITTGYGPIQLRNLRIKRSQSLAGALDQLLQPFGFSWRVDHSAAAFPLDKGKIKIVPTRGKRFDADGMTFKFPPEGATADFSTHEVTSFNINANVGRDTYNTCTVLSEVEEVQGQFTLTPAWPVTYDNVSIEQLKLSNVTAAHQRVHRDWVLNEDASYGLNPGPNEAYRDFESKARQPFIRRRRRFRPVMENRPGTSEVYGEWGGCTVYYLYDDAGVDAYARVENLARYGNLKILKTECGIRFVGEYPPHEIYEWVKMASAAGDMERRNCVSIIATIRMDQPKIGTASYEPQSMLGIARPLLLDLRKQYKFQRIDRITRGTSVARDDTANLNAVARERLKGYLSAGVNGSITIPRCTAENYVGKFIEGLGPGLVPRVSFETHGTVDRVEGFPVVKRQTWNFQSQEQTLLLESPANG